MSDLPDPDAVHLAHRKGYEAMLAKYGPEILRRAGRKGYQAMIARYDSATRREWCRKGYAAMLARYPEMPRIAGRAGFRRMIAVVGLERAFEKLAEALARRPQTALEQATATLLAQLGLGPGRDYLTQQLVTYHDANDTLRYAVVDFLGIHARWIIEPGHTRWHGDATQTLDGQDHTAREQCRLAGLTRSGYTVLALTEADLAPPQQDCTLARMRVVITQAPPTGLHPNNPTKER